MKQIRRSLALAAAMISIGVLAIFDIIPEGFAQWAPLALLAIFPSAWMGTSRSCRFGRKGGTA